MKSTTARRMLVSCAAKLNLTFDVLGLRADGYHDIETLFQSIDLEDILHMEFRPANALEVDISCSYVGEPGKFPCDDSNLIVAASRLFFSESGVDSAVSLSVNVEKSIPIAAGLAGGSANAAATLLALNDYADQPLSHQRLLQLAAKLGADVPFCLSGGLQVGRARGDELTAMDNAERMFFAVVRPREIAISTPWIYRTYDEYVSARGQTPRPHMQDAVRALASGNFELAAKSFGNVFQPVVFEHYPALKLVHQRLLDLGAWGCYITGSGPTLFALVPDREAAHYLRRQIIQDATANEALWTKSGLTLDCWIAEAVNRGATVLWKG